MSQDQDYFNRGGFIAFIFSMVFVFGFFFYIVVIHPGVDLGEKVVDPATMSDADKFDITSVSEPWVAEEKVAAYGAKVFKANCVLCHGEKGLGDGPGAAGIKPPPRNLVEGKWTQGGGSIAHYNVITNGIAGTSMASFATLSKGERWALVQYIDSLTQNKSTDDAAKIAEFAKSAK